MSTVLLCYYGVWPAVVRTADGGRPAHSHFHISTQTTRPLGGRELSLRGTTDTNTSG